MEIWMWMFLKHTFGHSQIACVPCGHVDLIATISAGDIEQNCLSLLPQFIYIMLHALNIELQFIRICECSRAMA